jgi:hypothetical protein
VSHFIFIRETFPRCPFELPSKEKLQVLSFCEKSHNRAKLLSALCFEMRDVFVPVDWLTDCVPINTL